MAKVKAGYTINVSVEREDKISVVITKPRCRPREFDIIVDENGLRITTDNQMAITPRAANSVYIDDV